MHMYSVGGTIGWENWHFGLPSFSAKLHLLLVLPNVGKIRSSWLMAVSDTALTMLLCSSVRLESLCTCPLSVVLSVGKIGVWAYRVSLRT